ncbi:MAG TPA: hypothetical protein VFH48_28315 [Chloroflexota bacterium]|nr:hypothetical protein [Chloroflexota bacterium]
MRGILAPEVGVPPDSKLVNTLIDPELLARIDDFRFTRRFKSRAAAMKYLLDWALRQNPEPTPEDHDRWS